MAITFLMPYMVDKPVCENWRAINDGTLPLDEALAKFKEIFVERIKHEHDLDLQDCVIEYQDIGSGPGGYDFLVFKHEKTRFAVHAQKYKPVKPTSSYLGEAYLEWARSGDGYQ